MHFFEKIYLDRLFQPRQSVKEAAAATSWRVLIGVILTINFLAFWGLPIFGMGQLWKLGVRQLVAPVFDLVDRNSLVRAFSHKFIYRSKDSTDFFLPSLLTILSILGSFAFLLWYQLRHGSLPWALILAYNCIWVGFGGRAMGTAYTMAHKEGHSPRLYRRGIHAVLGNIFENGIGILYGNVPNNFTTSHIQIHHRLNGGPGDTFFLWDLERCSLHDFMIYCHRVLMHTTGVSSLKYFALNDKPKLYQKLFQGFVTYWVYTPLVLLAVSNFSPSFVWWTFVEPHLCMSFFLGLINIGFHAFLEIDPKTKVPYDCICSTTIIDGEDDSFGEDDHMTHHNAPQVSHRDLGDYQAKQAAGREWKHLHASVFRGVSIVELSILVLIGQWDRLADLYVDYSGKLFKPEIMAMLEKRAKVKQVGFQEYITMTAGPIKPVTEKKFD
uniref:Fatty acid desaturase domain-containing protein n=1 Tax=Rhizochromulina marina TaxID=1034831 RepID=A0A7S2WIR8_9STRA|mmetsp:Transcript_2590/g.7600  ORF Transcript_2590/g.7600 Transcript_2590/m.7600 type:complete len:439 (+) Transcript_2590:304-1620(+)|eukprot:CAMPEP_0118987244 /NCGR_PEP_ID=MMETSP1173-20130426/43818_1 /TAXON_ID=1034831 /ORGANISM="Rhizochromulina marina cf, Strain CCMP1243" /LENGTH=438 /DNA_ID=CAMNT_0006938079 /DNA_START=269 /DNA_END=1585 /DNA_ORIENTATION=-